MHTRECVGASGKGGAHGLHGIYLNQDDVFYIYIFNIPSLFACEPASCSLTVTALHSRCLAEVGKFSLHELN